MSEDLAIIYHTGHFFERYNERCNLGLKTINEIIRAYMKENNEYDIKELEEIEPGIFKIFSIVQSGIMLGMHNKNLNLFKANTYIPNHMLSKNQSEMKQMFLDEIEKYRFTSDLLN
jgi:hypothetical protein